MSISGWLARPRASRESVLKELREIAKVWAEDAEDEALEDAQTLLALVEMMTQLNHDLDGVK